MRKKLKYMAIIALAFFVSFSFIMASVQESDAATRTFYLYKGSKIYYANTKTVYKYVKINGVARDAYCLEPSKDAPPKGNHSASTISTASAVARVLYFSRLAPGESQFRAYLRASGMGDRCSTNNKYYAFIHVILARAYQGEPKCWKIVEGGTLQAKYKNDVKKAYNWIMAQSIITDSAFSVRNGSASTVTAQYDIDTDTYSTKSTPFTMYGDAKQYFGFSVPKNATMYLKRRGSSSYGTYGAGASVNIYGGDSFYFVFNGNGTSFSRTAYGALASIIPWQMNYGSSKQDVGFFESTKSSSAAFGVTINKVDTGRIWLEKKKEMPGGGDAAEANTKFMVWKSDTYANAAAAKAANTKNRPVYAEIVTGADGTVTSGKLVTGTYTVSQMTAPDGYKKVPDQTVTVTKDQITKVNDGEYLLNELMPLKIVINKTDAVDGTLITDADATFGIYADAGCTNEFEQVTTVDGVATSSALEEGIYYIKEVEAPEDYVLSKEVKKVVLNYDTTNLNMSTECFEYTIDRFDNKPLTYHDIEIIKEITGDFEPGTEVTFEVEFRGLEPGEPNLTYATSGPDTAEPEYISQADCEDWIDSIDSNGHLSASITLTIDEVSSYNRGGCIWFEGIPSYADYKITEIVDGNVFKRASYILTDYSEYVTMPQKSLIPDGEGELSTGWQSFPGEMPDGAMWSYIFDNSTEDASDITINKTVTGAGASKSDSFTFNVSMSGLAASGSSYKIPGYIIYETDANGNENAVTSVAATTSATPTHNYAIRLKGGQTVKFLNVHPQTTYTIDEWPYEGYACTWQTDWEDAQTGSGGDAPVTETIPAAESLSIGYDYTNVHAVEPKFSKLKVNKTVSPTPETEEDFGVTITAGNLKSGEQYPAYYEGADGQWEANRIMVQLGNTDLDELSGGPLPCPFKLVTKDGTPVAGMPFTVTRSDGRTRTYKTNSDGEADIMSEALFHWAYDDGTAHSSGDSPTLHVSVLGCDFGLCFYDTETLAPYEESDYNEETVFLGDSGDYWYNYDDEWYDSDHDYEDGYITKYNYAGSLSAGTEGILDVTLQDGKEVIVDGFDDGMTYSVTEEANDYTPHYSIERYIAKANSKKILDSGSGSPKEDMTTETQTFGDSSPAYYDKVQERPRRSATEDTVALTNKLEYEDLEVTKTVDKGEKNKKFDFTVELENLKAGKTYTVISNGTDSYPISITADGDITITGTAQDSSPLSGAGIDVMLTRPDGEQKLFTTDANGEIPNSAYRTWLLAGCNRNATTANFKANYLNGSATFNVNYIEWDR